MLIFYSNSPSLIDSYLSDHMVENGQWAIKNILFHSACSRRRLSCSQGKSGENACTDYISSLVWYENNMKHTFLLYNYQIRTKTRSFFWKSMVKCRRDRQCRALRHFVLLTSWRSARRYVTFWLKLRLRSLKIDQLTDFPMISHLFNHWFEPLPI